VVFPFTQVMVVTLEAGAFTDPVALVAVELPVAFVAVEEPVAAVAAEEPV
jgi:hypothetical protein